jgi:hypothetical protein
LVEKISGTSYENFVRENIFTPLGMNDSGYDSNRAILARRASGYTRNGDHFENAGYINMTVPQGAGALYSTTEDLLKWEQGLFGGKLLKPASLEAMTTPFKNDYAFGLQVHTVKGHKLIDHSGGIEGFNTVLAYYPEGKLTVIVLGNVNGQVPDQIATQLAALNFGDKVVLPGERKEITLDSQLLRRYVGAYQMPEGPVMLITLENNRLSGKLGNQQALPIFPESPTRFFLKVVDAQIDFAADGSQLTLHQNGRDATAKRLDAAESKKVEDAAAAAAQRFKDQKAAPGSEAALRRLIGELQTGKPNYDLMSPGLAAATRQQLPQLEAATANLGAIQSVTFKGVGPAGADIYEVRFEKGGLEWRLSVGENGKIEGATFRPLQP